MAAAAFENYESDSPNSLNSNRFNKLNELQNIDTIASIFSHHTTIPELKKNASDPPVFILLVGSPGVGKTTQINKILQYKKFNDEYRMKFNITSQEHTTFDYDNFYKVSLDSLVERIRPYRKTTRELHKIMRNTRRHTKIGKRLYEEELLPEDYQILSEVYLPTIQSRKSNFGLNQTKQAIIKKIHNNKNTAKTSKTAICYCKKCKGEKEYTKQTVALHMKKYGHDNDDSNTVASINKTLIESIQSGIEYGIENELNIVYDCTITPTNTRLEYYLELLEEHNYNIIVILIEAPIDIVKKRIIERQKEMIHKEKYLRAIPSKLIERFIDENREGFNTLLDNPKYNKVMFYFQSN